MFLLYQTNRYGFVKNRSQTRLVIDPSLFCNFSRFINSSENPNCITRKFYLKKDREKKNKFYSGLHIFIIAKKTI
jgi:hypothetical protein